jgi:hypothetical protein
MNQEAFAKNEFSFTIPLHFYTNPSHENPKTGCPISRFRQGIRVKDHSPLPTKLDITPPSKTSIKGAGSKVKTAKSGLKVSVSNTLHTLWRGGGTLKPNPKAAPIRR